MIIRTAVHDPAAAIVQAWALLHALLVTASFAADKLHTCNSSLAVCSCALEPVFASLWMMFTAGMVLQDLLGPSIVSQIPSDMTQFNVLNDLVGAQVGGMGICTVCLTCCSSACRLSSRLNKTDHVALVTTCACSCAAAVVPFRSHD